MTSSTSNVNGISVEDDAYENDGYFAGYAHCAIQSMMLRDQHRCSAYRLAIDKFAESHFKNKVILDIGCGTGILSCLAARAGAQRVYAIEASEMSGIARLVVARNGYQSIIQVIPGKMEDIELPEQVDTIISEWMGNFLLFESMLESVLSARDKYLKPDGTMFPRYANIYMAPFSYVEFWNANVNFLDNVEGIDIGAMVPMARAQFTQATLKGMVVPSELLISDGQLVRRIDTRSITLEELIAPHTCAFQFTVSQRSPSESLPAIAYLPTMRRWQPGDPQDFHGFVFWFDTVFADGPDPSPDRTRPSFEPATFDDAAETVTLTTRPGNKTHWEQDVCLFLDTPPAPVGTPIQGIVNIRRNEQLKRHYDFEISCRIGETEVYKYNVT